MAIITMGLDLTKSIFVAHGGIRLAHPHLCARVPREALPGLMAKLPPLPAFGGDSDARTGAQRLPSDASTAPASASSRQGVTAIWSRSAHCA